MHEAHSITRILVTTCSVVDKKVQGWRNHQACKLTHMPHAYKWINPTEDGVYKSNITK